MPGTVKYPAELPAFSIKLKAARLSLQMTQKQVADKLSVTIDAVSHWERGIRPAQRFIVPIYHLLGVTPNDIFNITPETPRQ